MKKLFKTTEYKPYSKGVAIEMAMFTMFVVIALCLMMVSITELNAKANKNIVTRASVSAVVNQIGMDFASDFKAAQAKEYSSESEIFEALRRCLADFCSRTYDGYIPEVYSVTDKNRNRSTAVNGNYILRVVKDNKKKDNCLYVCLKTSSHQVLGDDEQPTGKLALSAEIIKWSGSDNDLYFAESNPELLVAKNGFNIFGYYLSYDNLLAAALPSDNNDDPSSGDDDPSAELPQNIIKNNYDLVEWAKNAYYSEWHYFQGMAGEVLTEAQYDYFIAAGVSFMGNIRNDDGSYSHPESLGKHCADCCGLIRGYSWFDEVNYTIENTRGSSWNSSGAWGNPVVNIENYNNSSYIPYVNQGGMYDLANMVYGGTNKIGSFLDLNNRSGIYTDGNLKYYGYSEERVKDSQTGQETERTRIIELGMPDVPGIMLYQSAHHIAIYVGDGMLIEESDYGTNMTYRTFDPSGWTHWFFMPTINYIGAEEYFDYSLPE